MFFSLFVQLGIEAYFGSKHFRGSVPGFGYLASYRKY